MKNLSFDEVWALLAKRLEGKTVQTLVIPHPSRIGRFLPTEMTREVPTEDGKGWKRGSPVPRRAFKKLWDSLSNEGITEVYGVGWGVAAGCLVNVPEFGIEKVPGRVPLTIRLKQSPTARAREERIVVDPEI